jgi:hypothetical protein
MRNDPIQRLICTLNDQIKALRAQKGAGPDADAERYREGMIAAYVNAKAHACSIVPQRPTQ